MGRVATDRPAVTHRRVAHPAGRIGQNAAGRLHFPRRGDFVMRSQRPNADHPARHADSPQPGDAPNVHHLRRPGQPQLQQRNQAMPPGNDFRIGILLQNLHRLSHRTGLAILKLRWIHR